MKNINQFVLILIVALSFACQNENHPTENENNLAVNDLVAHDIVDSIEHIELDSIIEESMPTAVGLGIAEWKTAQKYHHFISASLDTIYIGATREIKDPFEYFKESRSNVFVEIDSGRYLGDGALLVSGDNVIIKGDEGVSILIDKLYDNVMWITGNNIVVDNLHMMHLMPGNGDGQNCSGRVVGFDIADNVTIVNCDLNGCGLAGLHDNTGNGTVYVEYNYIHNNSLGAYTNIEGDVWQEEIPDHETFVFKNNKIENNGFDRVYEEGDDYYEEEFHGEH